MADTRVQLDVEDWVRLVEAQGGRVGVRSTPGQGSVFFAVLPRTARPAEVQPGVPTPPTA